MANWKDSALARIIQGAPGQGKSEVFINEYGIMVDANGIPIYDTVRGGLYGYVDPESYGVSVQQGNQKTKLNKGASFSSKKAPVVNQQVQSPWDTLAKEKDVGYKAGPGVSEPSKYSPEEADLLRRLYGF